MLNPPPPKKTSKQLNEQTNKQNQNQSRVQDPLLAKS